MPATGEEEGVGMKAVRFVGDSLDRLREFPLDAKREAGHQLDRVQNGLDPDDW